MPLDRIGSRSYLFDFEHDLIGKVCNPRLREGRPFPDHALATPRRVRRHACSPMTDRVTDAWLAGAAGCGHECAVVSSLGRDGFQKNEARRAANLICT